MNYHKSVPPYNLTPLKVKLYQKYIPPEIVILKILTLKRKWELNIGKTLKERVASIC